VHLLLEQFRERGRVERKIRRGRGKRRRTIRFAGFAEGEELN